MLCYDRGAAVIAMFDPIAILLVLGGLTILLFVVVRRWRSHARQGEAADDVLVQTKRVETKDPRYTGNVETLVTKESEAVFYEVKKPSGEIHHTSLKPSDHPESQYFASFDEISRLAKEGNFQGAADLAWNALGDLTSVAESWAKEYGSFGLSSIPPLQYLGEHFAVTMNNEGINALRKFVTSCKPLADEGWLDVVDDYASRAELVERILAHIQKSPGFLQRNLGKTLHIDGRTAATLMRHAEARGLVRRVKRGNSYELFPVDHDS